MPKKLFTPELQKEILDKIRKGKGAREASLEHKISWHTWRTWMQGKGEDHQAFRDEIAKAEQEAKENKFALVEFEHFTGRADVVIAKRKFLNVLSRAPNIYTAAEHCGITPRIVSIWGKNDPEFHDAVLMARERSVAYVEGLLFKAAEGAHPGKGNITAMLAYLNAHSADYGQVRKELLEKYLTPMLEGIIDIVEQFLDRESMDSFRGELDRLIIKVITGQSVKKRRR